MDSAQQELHHEIGNYHLNVPKLPIYANITAECYPQDQHECEEILPSQVTHPVLWEKTIRNMVEEGFTTFIEVGPGKTLSGLVKKINKDVTVCRVENKETLEETLRALGKETSEE